MSVEEFVSLYNGRLVRVNNNFPHAKRRIGMIGHVVGADVADSDGTLYVLVSLENGNGAFLPNELDVIVQDNKPLPLPG